MKNVKISILVPVYNVERYLARCIDSVLSQSFQEWELILVDDGSTDNCPRICDEYANKDKRIKVIHKLNGGLPSARQVGFINAVGEYLIFLDSDDWLLPNSLCVLINAIQSDGGYDIARSIVCRVDDKGKLWLEHYDVEKEIIKRGDFFSLLNTDSIAPYLHSGIYRADLFTEKSFQFLVNNKISVGEDWITNYYIAPNVNRVKFIDTPTYAYFLNTSSMMGSSVYGWEYYERIKKCMSEVNHNLCIKKQSDVTLESALHDLRFFFLPEVSFDWKQFRRIQPIIVEGIKSNNIHKGIVNLNYIRFISNGFLYYIYTVIFRYAFLILKLKGRRRKLIK